jgi:polyisoprenoid-binding protein YceI
LGWNDDGKPLRQEGSEMAETSNPYVRLIDGVEAPAPGDWVFDAVHTNIMFVARYAMLTKVRGRFNTFDGTIHVAEKPEDSWVELRIDASSISTDNEQRDAHLRSGDFLDLESEPDITFRSTKVERAEGSRFRITGELSIRGVKKEVTFDVDYAGMAVGIDGRTRVAFAAALEIDRDDYNVSWNMAIETGGVLVGKHVQIELEIQAVPKQ